LCVPGIILKRRLKLDEPLFPISRRVPGGLERKTHLVIQRDLAAARDGWLAEAQTPEEHARRLQSNFLCYAKHAGLHADFSSLRHLFITSLERAGLSSEMAQTLARHSDIRLTVGVYTHVELADRTAAIQALPSPPAGEQ